MRTSLVLTMALFIQTKVPGQTTSQAMRSPGDILRTLQADAADARAKADVAKTHATAAQDAATKAQKDADDAKTKASAAKKDADDAEAAAAAKETSFRDTISELESALTDIKSGKKQPADRQGPDRQGPDHQGPDHPAQYQPDKSINQDYSIPVANSALIEMTVQPMATVYLNGHDAGTKMGETIRVFRTPPLPIAPEGEGKYVYTAKAVWADGGVTRSSTKQVTVEAGKRVQVDLTTGDK